MMARNGVLAVVLLKVVLSGKALVSTRADSINVNIVRASNLELRFEYT